MPVVEEEGLLTDTQQTSDQGEDGQPVLGARAHVQGRGVQFLHEVLQTRNVDLVFNGLAEKGEEKGTVAVPNHLAGYYIFRVFFMAIK